MASFSPSSEPFDWSDPKNGIPLDQGYTAAWIVAIVVAVAAFVLVFLVVYATAVSLAA